MTGTPDRFPGSREETELLLRDQGSDPTEAGATRYVSGDFRMRDSLGVFNPRTGGSGTDEKVAVSSNDTTPGYLTDKLVAGVGIKLTELNDGADEDLRVAVKRWIQVAVTGDGNKAYQAVASPTYQTVGHVIWPGTNNWGTDGTDEACAIAWSAGTAPNGIKIRLYDSTNGNVIAESATITGGEPAVVSLGTVSNLPAGVAVFDVQGKTDGANGAISCICIEKAS
jgi:hypothetical protein